MMRVLEAMNILDGIDLQAMGHNSAAYIHTVAEALKLAAADREVGFGDPRVTWWPVREWLAGSVCTIKMDPRTDLKRGGADHRLTAYAIGW
jgi:gamma-glutamyltranspeptidase/glutathione hydrolase